MRAKTVAKCTMHECNMCAHATVSIRAREKMRNVDELRAYERGERRVNSRSKSL